MGNKGLIIRANEYEDIILDRSEGCWTWDTGGRRYLDMESGT